MDMARGLGGDEYGVLELIKIICDYLFQRDCRLRMVGGRNWYEPENRGASG